MAVDFQAQRRLAVYAEMDASKYVAGAKAVEGSSASAGKAVGGLGVTVQQTDQKISQSGDILARLSRQYVDGYAAAQRMQSAVNSLSRGIDSGKISMAQAEPILEGIYRKYGQLGDGAQFAAKGQVEFAEAIRNTAARLDAQTKAASAAAGAYQVYISQLRAAQAEESARSQSREYQARYNSLLGVVSPANSARDSAYAFEADFQRQQEIARMRSEQSSSYFGQDLNRRFGIGAEVSSARASASVFEEAAREADRLAGRVARLRAELNPLAAAQDRVNAEIAEYVAMAARGEISAMELAQAQALARSRLAANQNDFVSNRLATSNIAAQFQDIGVTSAMGMSPLQIALQQGTQLSAVFNDLRSQGQGVGATLAAAFGSIINPVSLVTLGVVGLSAVAIQYFTTWMNGSDESAEALEEQARLINKVAGEWGNALPALSAYNAEIEKQKSLQDAIAAAGVLAAQQYDPARSGLPQLRADIADIVVSLQQAGVESAQIGKVQNEFSQLKTALENSTATAQDALDVQQALSKDLLGVSIPAISDYAAQFGALASEIDKARQEATRFREEAGTLDMQRSMRPLNPLDGFNRTPFQTEEQIWAERQRRAALEEANRRAGAGVPIPTPRPNLESEPSAAASLLQTQADRIELLRAELGLVGQVDLVRSRAIANLQVEQEIRRAGIDLYGAEANQMRANAALELQLTEQLRESREAAARQRREEIASMDGVREGFRGFLGDLNRGIASGEGFFKSLENAGLNALNKIQDRALDLFTDALLGARGTNQQGLLGGFMQRLLGGAPGGGFAEAGGGFAGLIGYGLGGVANDNYAPGAVTRMPLPSIGATAANQNLGIEAYIRQAAQLRGIDPNVAVRAAMSEGGLKDPFRQGEAILSYGREESFGPFQLHMRQGGVGTRALKAGIDPRTNWQGGVDYALDEAANKGWGQWFGAAKVGIGNREGLENARALGEFTRATQEATQNLNGFDAGIGKVAQSLVGGTGAGASSGGLGGLFGLGLSNFGKGFNPTRTGFMDMLGGGAGASGGGGFLGWLMSLFGFAGGGYTGPGGVNDPRGIVHAGEVVFSQADIRRNGGVAAVEAMRRGAANGNSQAAAPKIVFQNTGTPQRLVEQREEDDGEGGRQVVYVLADQMTAAMNKPGTSINREMRGRGAQQARKRR